MTLEQFYNASNYIEDFDWIIKRKAVLSFSRPNTYEACNEILNSINDKNNYLIEYNKVKSIIESLSTEEQMLLKYRYRNGWTVDKVSEITGKSERTLVRKYTRIAKILMKGGVEINGRRTTTKPN